ncbi:hypothetical protein CEXT_186561 [Caerostris extrusa]|uniref:Endonuclease n=1 Tax=Caerostris extrusa TaxID=172846 RepID=A0AAV4VGE7_CAEEX|nr:hypothetical protein CEXT_186561 [Caerostris extrusa]
MERFTYTGLKYAPYVRRWSNNQLPYYGTFACNNQSLGASHVVPWSDFAPRQCTATGTLSKLAQFRWNVLEHPPYRPPPLTM